MKLYWRILLSITVAAAMLLYVILPVQYKILSPRLGQPAIIQPGESITILLQCNIPYLGSAFKVALLGNQTKQRLDLVSITQNFHEISIIAKIPAEFHNGRYSLVVEVGGETVSRQGAVHVYDALPEQLSIIQLADLPTLGGKGDELLDTLIAEINLINPSVVLFTGDLAYGGSWRQYRLLLAAMEKLNAPVIAAPGNHEYEGWSGFLTLLGNPYHAVNFGPYIFTSLNSGHGRDQLTLSQFRWLAESLSQNPSKIPIVQLHHPIMHRPELRGYLHHQVAQVRTLFENAKVPIVLAGHWHGDAVYDNSGQERTDTWQFDGTPYVVTTAAGADLRKQYSSSPLHHGYRLIRLQDSKLVSYTYDYDGDGQRDATSSIPVGNLHVQIKAPTHAIIKNDLAETFDNVKIKMVVPARHKKLKPNTGRISKYYTLGENQIYEILLKLPAQSQIEILLK